MLPLLNARCRRFPLASLRPAGWSIAAVALAAALVQACVHVPGPHAVPVGPYHFRFIADTASTASEEWESLADRGGSLELGPRERTGCDGPRDGCWDLEGEYALTPVGHVIVQAALRKAGIEDSLPARGRATGAWRERPGGAFWVILNDSGPGPRVELRAGPGRKHWTAVGEWCADTCAAGTAGKLVVVRSKR